MIERICNILNEDDLWIFYTDEGSDKYFKKYISQGVVGLSVAFVSNKKCKVLVSGLDEKNINIDKEIFNSTKEFEELFSKIICEFNYPKNVYLNFGKTPQIDTLGHGAYLRLENILTNIYGAKNLNLGSSTDLIYKIEETNDEDDEKYFRLAAARANSILELAFTKIETGMTEKQIADIVKKEVNGIGFKSFYEDENVVSEDFSWGEPCPIVLVGKNLKLGGHTSPSDTVFKKGDTIYFDFGVKITANGKEYCSDIQRMGYALKDGEEKAPKEVQDVFDTLVLAIEEGRKFANKNVCGYQVDELVRGIILKKGYPDYNHGTGHAVKDTCHAVGTRLSRKGVFDTDRLLQDTGIYTIEPRIMIENGGSIEEMIIVKGDRAEFISPRQEELYLIKG